MVKKLLSLVLCLLMITSCAALAETAADETMPASAEEAFEGVWVQFEDGFEIYLPAEWLEQEVTDEMLESGIFYSVISPDEAYSCEIGWAGLEQEMTLEEVQADLATEYPDATIIEMPGVEMVFFTDVENDVMACFALDAVEPGLYMFFFTPASDEDFALQAAYIASSIRNIEDAEAAAE